ncbi:MAG: lipase maturation factor family protein [Candidatus Marinimicrobia bacterium]|nr:lipase maturation factor family protein [Candidatus Neomarinimicrobiota bacterium]
MKKIINKLKNAYFVDTRTLAIFRIALGILGMWDVLRRYYLIDAFYSFNGMDFRRQITSSYSVKYFTLLDTFQTSIEVQLFFIFTIICFFLLMIGYRTRLFQILSAFGLLSIHNAAVILENGGDMVFNNYLIWTLFLPLGKSWSIDSLKSSLQNFPEKDSTNLNTPLPKPKFKIFHVAYIACLVQLAMIYFYNYINKTGNMWSDGSAVYYMYQLDTFLTPIGNWIQQHLTLNLSVFLTKSTLIIELIAPIFILSPILQPWLRRIIIFLLIGFHLMIGISVGIGLFSWIMIAVVLLLLSHDDINLLKQYLSKFFRSEYIVFYDRDCGFCHLTARIIKRLDVFNRFSWADRLYGGDKPKNVLTELESTIVVWNKDTNQIWTRHKGFSRIISALPFGFIVSWILVIPGLEKVFGYMYDKISQNRTDISVTMGLSACGIPDKVDSQESPYPIQIQSFAKCKKMTWVLGNVLVLFLIIGAVDYSMHINEGLSSKDGKKELIVKQPSNNKFLKQLRLKMKHILLYPRMYQQWNMFSPSVIKSEKWLVGDISFNNGKSISLFINNLGIEKKMNRTHIQPYQEQFWRKLFSRINNTSYKKYIPDFKDWLKDTEFFPEYRGRTVKNVTLWQLSESSPKPESTKSPSVRKTEVVPGFKTNLSRKTNNSNRKNNRRVPKKKL